MAEIELVRSPFFTLSLIHICWIKWVFVFVIPLAVASIVCGIFYAQMKTANEQTHANAYMPAEGLALSVVCLLYTSRCV